MIYQHEDGELRVAFSWDMVWYGLGVGALLGLLIVVLILGSALIGPELKDLLL